MSFIGVLEAFTGDDFESYEERLEAYFAANDIGQVGDDDTGAIKKKADKKKVSHAIAVMGKTTYKTLKDLCQPNKPQDKPFAEICKILNDY